MAKKSAVERNEKRMRMVERFAAKRARLKAATRDKSLSDEERFEAQIKLAQLPRNSAQNRVRLRCGITGRPRGNYRKFKLSR
ncbi:MAG: 30S ribosomal protein S14, partial [Rhodospirillaceae bacterium]|nr:30S ribosomal protein S14 [Rhodospirillaceae bacterium]